MSYSKFTLALKSTIDYYAKQLADSKNLPFVDLDAPTFESEVLESDQPAVCWQFASLAEDPVDPLYLVMFDVGVMTMIDPSQYVSLDYVSMFLESFRAGKTMSIMDYSGAQLPTVIEGGLYIVSAAVTPQQADRATGIRFVTITARATRNV